MDTKSPEDTEIDTPPHTAQPINYVSPPKNHHFICRRDQPSATAAATAYKQCMKNHAAAIGGHAVDGCGEFMPSPSSSTADPASLTCAACGCHRNFHRREVPTSPSPTAAITPPFLDFRHPKRFSPSPSPPPHPVPPHLFFGVTAAAVAEDSHQAPVTPTVENPVGSRKRFRTRFSQEQKEKMHSFSVKLGWKLQRCDDVAVREFCHEIGVSKGVLKVWMHNNKNTFGKKEINGGGGSVSDSGGGGGNGNESGNGGHFNGEGVKQIKVIKDYEFLKIFP